MEVYSSGGALVGVWRHGCLDVRNRAEVPKHVRCLPLCILESCAEGAGGCSLCLGGREGRATYAEDAGGCALCVGGSEWCATCATGYWRPLLCMLFCILDVGECEPCLLEALE